MTNTNNGTEWVSSVAQCYMGDGVMEQIERLTLTVDHGIADYKKRAIGGVAVIAVSAGRVHLNVGPTRNGQKFGAITRSTICDTIEQAKALAARKLAAQRERYAKMPGNTVAATAA